MRPALSLLLVIGAAAAPAVFAAVDGPPPCRRGFALNLRGDCVEGDEQSAQLAVPSHRRATESGRHAVSAPDVLTAEARDEVERHQRQRGRRPKGRRRGRGGGRRRGGSHRRGKPRRRQRVQNAPGLLMGVRRRRPCPKGFIRYKPRGRCFKRRFKSPYARDRAWRPKNAASGPFGGAFQTSATIPPSGSDSSPRGRQRCPGGYLRHSGGRCLRLGSETQLGTRRGPKPGPMQESPELCREGRLAWKDGNCVPLATLRSCPKDSYRLKSGLCVRCWVSDKVEGSCAAGCAVDEQRSKCICCQPNGDDP